MIDTFVVLLFGLACGQPAVPSPPNWMTSSPMNVAPIPPAISPSAPAPPPAQPAVKCACSPSVLGDGKCDQQCNNLACRFDNKDCMSDPAMYCNKYLDACKAAANATVNNTITTTCGTLQVTATCLLDAGHACWNASWVGVCKNAKVICPASLKCPSLNCAPGCSPSMLANGNCEPACNVKACNYDDGDCATTTCTKLCDKSLIKNGVCNGVCNNAKCAWDGGDCAALCDQRISQCRNKTQGRKSNPPPCDGFQTTTNCAINLQAAYGCYNQWYISCKNIANSLCVTNNCPTPGPAIVVPSTPPPPPPMAPTSTPMPPPPPSTPIPMSAACNTTLCLIGRGYTNVSKVKDVCGYYQAQMTCLNSLGPKCYNAKWKGVCLRFQPICFSLHCPQGTQCSPGCDPTYVGNGKCDSACNTTACKQDGGDCAPVQTCPPQCTPKMRGNGVCDAACNLDSCNFDDGDCGIHGNGTCGSFLAKCQLKHGYNASDIHNYCGYMDTTFRCLEQAGKNCYNRTWANICKNMAASVCPSIQCPGQCPLACSPNMRGDGTCNSVCNVATCNFDDGDCTGGKNKSHTCDGWCLHDGLCWQPTGCNHLVCDCPSEWAGARCHSRPFRDSCSGFCRNNGTSYVRGSCDGTRGQCVCVCRTPYFGTHCEFTDPCFHNPCKNGATCSDVSKIHVAYCKCPAGWSGKHCETKDVDVCAQNPCKNGGTCTPKYGVAYCDCAKGYFGQNCSSMIAPKPSKCNRHKLSTCMFSNNGLDPNNLCATYTFYAGCAVKASCPDMLDIWCGILFKKDPDCKIQACINRKSACNTYVYQQCYINVTNTNFADKCAYYKAFRGCAVYGHCSDIANHACGSATKAGCTLAGCSASSNSELEDTLEMRLLDSTVDFLRPDSIEAAWSRPQPKKRYEWVIAAVGCPVVAVLVGFMAVLYKRRMSVVEPEIEDPFL